MAGFAWVTLATNDSYSLGALVLAHSLRRVNTAHQLVVLVTPGVTESMKTQLSAVFNGVKVVDVLDSRDAENLALLARPELGITFTKLHCWKLTQYDKCVFLDADTLVLQNCDELFEREELSAAPDAGWPDCFNSGVFVYKPSDDTFKALIEFAMIHGSFDGGDQGLLNLFFSDWATKDIKKHLPFVYNMCSTATYSYLPAFKQYGQGLKIIHFIGNAKPWLQPFNTETGLVQLWAESSHITQFVQLWWDIFCSHVHPTLSTEMAGLAGALATVTLGAPLSVEQAALEEHLRRQGWEQGHIDYMGKDSFSNIWRKICDTLASGGVAPPRIQPEAPAPVAPVAAPTFVSSVEISPSGPVDTSPPANYAPVSVLEQSVVASQVPPVETTTVVPEPKSPSVAEVVSPDASVTPSSTAALDTTAKPPTTPAPVAQPPVESVESKEKASPPVVSQEVTPLLGQITPSVISDPKAPPLVLSTSITPTPGVPLLISQASEPSPPLPTPGDFTPTSPDKTTPSPLAISPPPKSSIETPPQTPPSATTGSTVPPPTPIEGPKQPQTPTSAVPPDIPKQPQTPTSAVPTELPKQPQIPSSPVLTEVPKQPLTPTSAVPTELPKQPQTPTSAVPTEVPKQPQAPTSTVPTEVPKQPQTPTSAAPSEVPKQPQTPTSAVPTEVPKQPQTPTSAAPTEVPKQPQSPTSPVPTEVSKQPQTPPSVASPVQPGTPTVTGPTPPTSPPISGVEGLLASKLQVTTEVPETPPVGASAEQPGLSKSSGEEPPVPPKRKGGAKAQQEPKASKGKPAKGKK